MSALTTPISPWSYAVIATGMSPQKEIKGIQFEKEGIKLFLLINNQIVKNILKKLLELGSEFSNTAGHRINTLKSHIIIYE